MREGMTQDGLEDFFASCDTQEEGAEPDWEEHLQVIERSRQSGLAAS